MMEPDSTLKSSSNYSMHGDTEDITNLKTNSYSYLINMEEDRMPNDLRRELARLQEREALLSQLLCLEREKRVKAEQLVEVEHQACLELGERLGRERKLVAAVRRRAFQLIEHNSRAEEDVSKSKDGGITIQENGGELQTRMNSKVGMEPRLDDVLQTSPPVSSQGSDSGLATLSPQETEFSASVFSQLTSDLQQMLGVGSTIDSCLEQRSCLAQAKDAIESDNARQLQNCILSLDVDALANEGVEPEEEGAELEEERDKGKSLLELASECGRRGCVKVLLDAGFDPNWKSSRKDGLSALHLAAINGYHDTLLLLLKSRADPHCQDSDGRTPLFLAVRGGHAKCVQTLLEYGAKVEILTKLGETALHAAVLANSPFILRNLIVQMRIAMETVEMTSVVNHCDSDGRTPLHLAVSLGYKECAEVLCVRADIDMVKRDRWNRTPLDVATPNCKEILLNRESRQVVVYVEGCCSSPVHSSSNLMSNSDYRTAIGRISILRHHKPSDLELLVEESFKQYWNALKVFGNSRSIEDTSSETSLSQRELNGINFWENCSSLNERITTTFSLSKAFIDHNDEEGDSVNPDMKESYLNWSKVLLKRCRSCTATMDLTKESILSYRVGSMSWKPGEIPSSAKPKTLFSLFGELERQQQGHGQTGRGVLEEGERLSEVTISLKGFREGCLDQLAFDSMTPLYKLKEYTNLIEEHKALMIHGAQGSGKTYLALALANHLKYKHGAQGTQVVHVALHPNFQRDDLFRLLHINGLLVSASEEKGEGLNRQRKLSTTSQPGTFIVVLDGLSQVVVPNVLAELLTCLTYQGPKNPLWISDVFNRDGGSLLYPCGHYYLHPHCYFIATQSHQRGNMELTSIDHFPHISLDYRSEPSIGILRRQLTAKLIHCSLGDFPYNASFLPRLLLWTIDIWQLYNHLVLSLDLPELTCGFKHFLQCPLDSKDPEVIINWICSLWNFHLAPSIESTIQSDPRLSVMGQQFNGSIVKSHQKVEQHRYKALMQLLLACTRLVFLPTCPLQLEMKLKLMEQLTSRLEGLLNSDRGKAGRDNRNMDIQSNAGARTPPLPPHIMNRGTPPTPGKSQDHRGSGSLLKHHPPSSSSSPSSKADNMVSYEDMIRNSPRNTPKMPKNKPPAPQKAHSSGAMEAMVKLDSPPRSLGPMASVVSRRKPPSPAHSAAMSVKKPPLSPAAGEGSPKIMEGVKLREKSDTGRSKTLRKLRSKTIALFSKEGGYSTLPRLFRKGSRASLVSLSEEEPKKSQANELHRSRPKSESQQLGDLFDILSSASSNRYEEQCSPPPPSPPPEELEEAGPGGEVTDGDDLDDIFDLMTTINSDRIDGQRSAGPSPIKQNSSVASSPEKSKKKRKVAKYFLPTGSPFSSRKSRQKNDTGPSSSPTNFSMPDLTVDSVEPTTLKSGYFGSRSTSNTPNRVRARISSEVYVHGRASYTPSPRGYNYHQSHTQSTSEGTRTRSNSFSSDSHHTVNGGGYSVVARHFMHSQNRAQMYGDSGSSSYATDPIARRLLGHSRSHEQSIPSPLAVSFPSVNHPNPTSPLATTAYSSGYQDAFYTESETSPYISHQHTQSSSSTTNTASLNEGSPFISHQHTRSNSTTHTGSQCDEVADSSLLLQKSRNQDNFHGSSGYPESFNEGIAAASVPQDMAPLSSSTSRPAKRLQARSVENLKANDDDIGAFDLFRAASDGEINQSSSPSPYHVEENHFQFKQNTHHHHHHQPQQQSKPLSIVNSATKSDSGSRGATSITMMHCDYHSIYPKEKSASCPQPVVGSTATGSSINTKGVTSITMMHCNYHSIYPEDTANPSSSPPDFSPTQAKSMSSTTDPYSYDRHSDQLTRRRSDTTSGNPYELQPKHHSDDLSDISPRRHSVTVSDRHYCRNKSNSSESSSVSQTLSSPTGSKIIRRSSDATNLLFSATLGGFSSLISAGSRDRLASKQCNDENVAEM